MPATISALASGVFWLGVARELEAVVVVYKSVDGSLKEKRVDIRASFDWRDTIYISRQAMPKNGEVVDVSVTAQGGSTEAKTITNLTEAPPLQALFPLKFPCIKYPEGSHYSPHRHRESYIFHPGSAA